MTPPGLALTTAGPMASGSDAGPAVDGYDGFIGWVLRLMTDLGEVGVGLALLIETVFPPMPSEAVLPAAGFLAAADRMSLWSAILAATVGAVLGAWLLFFLGALLGPDRTRRLVARLPLMDAADFDKADRFFARWGGLSVLIGRCVPVVRSLISIPAGIERMGFWRFTGYTFLGSGVWNGVWIGLGFAFGPAVEPVLARWSGILSNAVLAAIAALCLWFVIARLRRNARRRQQAAR